MVKDINIEGDDLIIEKEEYECPDPELRESLKKRLELELGLPLTPKQIKKITTANRL